MNSALSGNTTLGARGPVYGSEHYNSTLRLALSHARRHKGAQTPDHAGAPGAPECSSQSPSHSSEVSLEGRASALRSRSLSTGYQLRGAASCYVP